MSSCEMSRHKQGKKTRSAQVHETRTGRDGAGVGRDGAARRGGGGEGAAAAEGGKSADASRKAGGVRLEGGKERTLLDALARCVTRALQP